MAVDANTPRRDSVVRGWTIGACVGAGTTVLLGLRGGSWDWGLSLLMGITLGVSTAGFAIRERQNLVDATSGAPPKALRQADSLLRRPTATADPAVRDLAEAMAHHRLSRLELSRPRPAVFCGVVSCVFILLALVWLPRLWLGAIVFGVLCLAALGAARWLRRRLLCFGEQTSLQ